MYFIFYLGRHNISALKHASKTAFFKLLAEVQAVKLNATQWMCDVQPGHGDIYISTMFLF